MTDQFGRVDVLCNNAAYIAKWHDVLNATPEEWDGCLHVTIMGTQNFTGAVLPWIITAETRLDHHHVVDPRHGGDAQRH